MAYDTRLGAGVRQLGDTDSYKIIRGVDVDLKTDLSEITDGNLVNADVFIVDQGHSGTQASTKFVLAGSLVTFMESNLSDFNNSTKGLVPSPGNSGTAVNYLREDGSWAIPTDTWTLLDSTTSGYVTAEGNGDTTLFLNGNGAWSTPTYLTIGSASTTALAGDTTTISATQASEITTNTSKVTNVTTNLDVNTSATTVVVTSSDGNDATIPVATTSIGGVMSKVMFDEHTANVGKSTNVVTNLSVASSVGARVIASSDGTDATIPIATTSVSGVMSTTIFDEHTANVAKETNVVQTTITGNAATATALTAGDQTITGNLTTTGHIELGNASDTTIARSTAGKVTIESKEIVTLNRMRQAFNLNFFDGISDNEHWLSWRDKVEASSALTDPVDTEFMCPANGRLHSVTFSVGTISGSGMTTTFALWRAQSSFPFEEVDSSTPIGADDDNDRFVVFFTDENHFNAGDRIKVSIQNSAANESTSNHYITAVIEFDYTNMGRTTSGKIY